MTDLVFADELPVPGVDEAAPKPLEPWVVMIVDDDVAVHQVTQLVMADFEFSGRRLQFLDAYSGIEARELLKSRNDVALILLDVVMESEHAGLDVARYIRDELKNNHVRIVLRTGQPGQAPEEHVIKTYDINDYKEKTELTKRKLITVFYAALRSYRDIMIIEQSRQALRRSIDAITRVYDSQNLRRFASAVLEQVTHLLGMDARALCASRVSAYAASNCEGHLKVLAATADYSRLLVDDEISNLPPEVKTALDRALIDQCGYFDAHHFIGYYRSSTDNETLLYMQFSDPVDAQARELLEIFCANVAITYESLLLREEIQETQRSTVFILGEAVERRSKETGAHVRRVGELSALLAESSGMRAADVEFMRQASPLHDVGKIGIPDRVLNKPGKLDAEEWEIMKTHARIGFELLSKSDKRILQLGAIIAHEHHERWDGAGYPRGLLGDQINIAGRIVALADVLDALVSGRCYKEAWEFDAALGYITEQSGKQFDPALVQQLLDHLEAVHEIYRRYPDA
jgi:response regulator RpfG family c-di-GMP phosphodiesterase